MRVNRSRDEYAGEIQTVFRNWQCSDKTINDIESSGILPDKGRSPSGKMQPSPGRQGRRRSWRGERVAQTIMRDLVSGSLPGSRQFHEDARGAKPRVRWKIKHGQNTHEFGNGRLCALKKKSVTRSCSAPD